MKSKHDYSLRTSWEKILALAFCMCFTLISIQCAEPKGTEALFGLQWGMSPSLVKKEGVKLTFIVQNGSLFTYKTGSLPDDGGDANEYRLVFNDNLHLVKIVMVGNTITEDDTGKEGKSRFEEYAKPFKTRYKEVKISQNQVVGIDRTVRPDEFYQCLKHVGCGMWAQAFTGEDIEIVLELRGLGKGEGYIKITAEAVPEWGQILTGQKDQLTN